CELRFRGATTRRVPIVSGREPVTVIPLPANSRAFTVTPAAGRAAPAVSLTLSFAVAVASEVTDGAASTPRTGSYPAKSTSPTLATVANGRMPFTSPGLDPA